MARLNRLGVMRQVHDEHAGRGSDDRFQAAYLHYVARCKALGLDPMPRDELRSLLSSAHASRETQGPQL